MVNISIFRLIVVALVLIGASNAQPLSPPSSRGCNNKTILANIKKVVKAAVAKENRMGASLLRLHFHDCFVNGCDGSVLLDDNANISFTGEKNAAPNANSLRGFDIIDNIKSLVESSCPSRISCADILAVAARDAVIELGGRGWNVAFGRNDSTTASLEEANNVLPGPGSNLGDLVSAFKAKGFNTSEMVALSGSHTIGFARCRFFRNRIYSNTNISAGLAAKRQAECPRTGGDDNLSPLDTLTPTKFNNDYYKNLMNMSGLFNSDQQLFNNGSTDALVRIYAAKPSRFFADFASAMAKMAVLPPLPGAKGQIRTNCHRVN